MAPPPGENPASSPAEAVSAAEERFDRMRRTVGLFLGPALGLLVLLLPFPSLSAEAHRLSAVLAVVVTYWVTEAIPIPVTALMGPLLCILAGVGPARETLAGFANPIIFLFIGSFFIAQAMVSHRLDRRMALAVLSLRWVGAHPARLLFAFGGITAFLSMWMSNTATAAMMFPIALGILGAVRATSGGAPGPDRFGTGLMLMTAYAASVGGIGTIIGTPPNLIGIGLIRQQLGVEIGFLGWMAFAVPMLIVMYLALYFLLWGLHRPAGVRIEGAGEFIRRERERLGGWTAGQRNTAAAFLTAVALWIAPGLIALTAGTESRAYRWFEARLPEGLVALLAALLLFLLPVDWGRRRFTLSWDEAVRIDWGTILLFGGGLALGDLMFKTGLAGAFGHAMAAGLSLDTPGGITAMAIAMGIITSELTSNTASANMVIPVVISIAQAAGVNPLAPALGACLGASYGFMLPISTPPNAIVYGSGLVPITRMIRAGILFDLLGFLIIALGLKLLCPWIGCA